MNPLIHVLLQGVLIRPTTKWILKPNRFSRIKGCVVAMLFLLIVFGGTVFLEDYANSEPNCYQVLGVSRLASKREVKRAFRKKSLETHPDKFSDEHEKERAKVRFNRVRESYETLSDDSLRGVWERFGPEALKQKREPSL